MKVSYINYQETASFSPTVLKYLDQSPELNPFLSYWPTLDGFEKLLKNKQVTVNRKLLVDTLQKQYGKILEKDSKVLSNLETLLLKNTFTVTTGHQLNLFTGPLYFIYKIVTAINLAKKLTEQFPEKNFVPIYWMASEDHDFEEINHVFLHEKKIFGNLKHTEL